MGGGGTGRGFGDKPQRRGPLPRIDKSKVLSLLLHAADISHPTKQWAVHSRWTKALMEEFFRQVGSPGEGTGGGTRGPPRGDASPLALPCQGDKEAELGLPFSPLCDRTSTLVAQSQIGEWCRVPRVPHLGPHPVPAAGPNVSPWPPRPFPTTGFIDFIVEPTFSVLTDVAEKLVLPLAEDGTKAKGNPAAGQQPRWAAPSCLSFPTPRRWLGLFWERGGGGGGSGQLSPSPQLAVAAAVPGRALGAGGGEG